MRHGGVVDDARGHTTLCLAMREGPFVTVGIGVARGNEPDPGQVWPELSPWELYDLPRNLLRARIWARRVGKNCVAVPVLTAAQRPADWSAQQVYDNHEVLMLHGQRICFHRNPACRRCVLLDLCPEGESRRTAAAAAAGIAISALLGWWYLHPAADAPKVVLPDRDDMRKHMDSLIHHFLIVAEGFNIPEGEVYMPIEGSKGELGVYMKSDGGPKPSRVHVRGPSFINLQALPVMSEGEMVADVVAIIGSLDIVLGEIDR